jgi:hypothetical protein
MSKRTPSHSTDLIGYVAKVESYLRNTKHTEFGDQIEVISEDFLDTFGCKYTAQYMYDILKIVQPSLFENPGHYTWMIEVFNARKKCMINRDRASLKSAIQFYLEIYVSFDS